MSIQTWAEKEIDIACKRERADSKVEDGDWDYGCACYESALKAYKSLMKDGHRSEIITCSVSEEES